MQRRPKRAAAPSIRDLVDVSRARRFSVHVHAIDDLLNEYEEAVDSDSDNEIEETEIDQLATYDTDDSSTDTPHSSVNGAGDNSNLIGRDGTKWETNPVEVLSRRRTADIVREASRVNEGCDTASISSVFSSLFTTEMEDLVIKYTNMYARQYIADHEPHGGWYTERWKDIDRQEFRAFVGCLVFAGVSHAQHEALEELWSQDTGRPFLYATMSLKRFQIIMKFLRFDDTTTRAERRTSDKLAPIRELWELFQEQCRQCYSPGAFLTVDEQLIPFRGRCSFRVYMKSKPDRYGLKVWVIADSELHYALNSQIYLGKAGNNPEVGQGQRVVMELSEKYHGSGRNITCDNFLPLSPWRTHYLLRHSLWLVPYVQTRRNCLLNSKVIPIAKSIPPSSVFRNI